MVNVAGASYNDPSQGTRGGSIILPSRFLSILNYFSIIFCGCTHVSDTSDMNLEYAGGYHTRIQSLLLVLNNNENHKGENMEYEIK
jgi:hypothetical protein